MSMASSKLRKPTFSRSFPTRSGLRQMDGRTCLLRQHGVQQLWTAQRRLPGIDREADAVRGWIMQRCERDALSPSGLGREVYAGVDAGEISADEAILLVRSLLSAGVDTTVDAIGSILLCFGKHPAEWEKLRNDPSRARSAIEEVLRYESPFQTFFRTTTCDVSLAGQKIEKNQKIMVSIGSANRDPASGKIRRPSI